MEKGLSFLSPDYELHFYSAIESEVVSIFSRLALAPAKKYSEAQVYIQGRRQWQPEWAF